MANEYIPEECSFCGCKGTLNKTDRPGMSPDVKWLCEVCYTTLAGNHAFNYQDNTDTVKIMAQMTNLVLREIRALKPSSQAKP
jgi:hypothetical protein